MHTLRPSAAPIFHPPPSFINPPPLEGYFQGWGVGAHNIRPCIEVMSRPSWGISSHVADQLGGTLTADSRESPEGS